MPFQRTATTLPLPLSNQLPVALEAGRAFHLGGGRSLFWPHSYCRVCATDDIGVLNRELLPVHPGIAFGINWGVDRRAVNVL